MINKTYKELKEKRELEVEVLQGISKIAEEIEKKIIKINKEIKKLIEKNPELMEEEFINWVIKNGKK